MAGPAKKTEPEVLVVTVPFAYPTTKANEVRMLTKGTVINPDDYAEASISHLKEIGFIGSGS
jgi:hypothetical protein